MDNVKQEMESVKSIVRRMAATLVRLEGKMDDLAANVLTKEDGSRIDQRFDGISAQIEDLRFRYAVHADTLKTHSERLDKLEGSDS